MIDPAESSRADLYRILARLWLAAPNRELLQSLQQAGDSTPSDGHLAAPWQTLLAALRSTTVQAAADEYEALFQGVGKPEILPYGSYYLAGALNERPLVRLRDDLRELGLTRDPQRGETEDHIAFLFEVMRYLIVGDDLAVCNLERQRRLFRAHLQPWIEQLCDTVEVHPRAVTWRVVAALTRSFIQVETQAFDLLEA